MENTQLLEILEPLETAPIITLEENDPKVQAMIEETQKKQEEILKLKEIEYQDLQVVFQL